VDKTLAQSVMEASEFLQRLSFCMQYCFLQTENPKQKITGFSSNVLPGSLAMYSVGTT
jgi:hypothetical protein